MKPTACPRLFEAEALRDGRLGGAALVSFARHASACAACRREAQALERVAEAVRAGPREDAQSDELHALRERTRLIAAFDATLVSSPRRRGSFSRALLPAAAVVLLAGGLFLWRARQGTNVGAVSHVAVTPSPAAVWSRRTEGTRETLTLERGDLWVHVDHVGLHSQPHAQLLIALPDGELVDTGTTFTVSVTNGRTTRVVVQEGSVVLRIVGRAPVTLEAASVWTPEAPVESARVAPLPPPDRNLPSERPPTAVASPLLEATKRRRTLVPSARALGSRRSATVPSVESSEAPDLAVAFRSAVAALDVGASCEAAAAFARFASDHPRDGRAEDAAYLRVIALERCGDKDETKRAAQTYLRRYPTGFRRAEIEKLSR